MPQLTIELSPDELKLLHALALRKRRTDAQQAAHSLMARLYEREERRDQRREVADRLEQERRRTTAEAQRIQRELAEAERGGDPIRREADAAYERATERSSP